MLKMVLFIKFTSSALSDFLCKLIISSNLINIYDALIKLQELNSKSLPLQFVQLRKNDHNNAESKTYVTFNIVKYMSCIIIFIF